VTATTRARGRSVIAAHDWKTSSLEATWCSRCGG
jgi:hypothetical protein